MIPLYQELKTSYLNGELEMADDQWFSMHFNEYRRSLGDRYALFICGKEFKAWVDFDQQNEAILGKLIWGIYETEGRTKRITTG